MRIVFFAVALLLFVSCRHCIESINDGDEIIYGTWGGYIIEAGGMKFKTIVGIRTIAHPVELVGHDWIWNIWSPGYGEPVERIE